MSLEEGGDYSNNIYADGQFEGVNWSYKNDTVIYYAAPTKEMAEMANNMNGKRPDRYFFDLINGRGIDVEIFKHLNISDAETFGKYREVETPKGRIIQNLTGQITRLGATEYVWDYKLDGFSFHYVTKLEL